MERYFIKTYGCQMNVADSEMMAGILESRGMKPADSPTDADLVVVNTCAIRHKAEEKAYSELGRLIKMKKRGGKPNIIAAAGCVARQDGERLHKKHHGLDIVVGPRRHFKLGELLDYRLATGKAVVDVADEPTGLFPAIPVRGGGVTAFVTIMQGCDNHCAYCVVPSVRGAEISRSPDEIEEEVAGLVSRGFKDITLLGQNVNSYGKGLGRNVRFPDLLEMLDRRTGISRIRFTTSHPKDFGNDLIQAIRDLPSVCEAVHLPVQAGSDAVLRSMNRGYTAAEYMDLLACIREQVPGVSVSTDIIVGYPAERDEDFDQTYSLVREAAFSNLFAFKFSPRRGTAAAHLTDCVTMEVKNRRLQSILDLQKSITWEFHQSMIGNEVEVLVEDTSKSDPLKMSGRTRGNQVVNFPGDGSLRGRLISLTIMEARQNCLMGAVARSMEND